MSDALRRAKRQKMKIGAHYLGNRKCEFIIWAPFPEKVELIIISPEKQVIPLKKGERGYWMTVVEDTLPGTRYIYCINGKRDLPDPASYFQPEGVHGASQVLEHESFHWEDDDWIGRELSEMIMYELHVGTFTSEGTFDAIIPRLDEIKDTGLNTIEIMPVAQFPGERNWGYDGTYLFAVQNSYGGPDGLKKLVNKCHKMGIAVILDVVYNHLGPEGNYLQDFGPYFTDKYKTPWGDAVNFDGPYSDEVRWFFIENALYWITEYHIDALRIDAIHGIFDFSAKQFLQELGEAVHNQAERLGRKIYVITESDLNDVRVINPVEIGGYGLDAQWNDDFHHALHTAITSEKNGYYEDFGMIGHIERAFKEGFVYSGQYSPYRKRRHGSSSKSSPAHQFIVFSQNHDQVGNRMLGERLSSLVSFESLKLAASSVFLSPYVPLIFMGEEYGEEAPFLYFVSHSDAGLLEAVKKGRRAEFNAFNWEAEPPDPESMETFQRSKIKWERRYSGRYRVLLDFYKKLIHLRKKIPALSHLSKECLDVWGLEDRKILFMRRWKGESEVFCIFNFNHTDIRLTAPLSPGVWKKILDSSDTVWDGPETLLPENIGQGEEIVVRGQSSAVYMREETD